VRGVVTLYIYICIDTLPADIHLAETPSDADANEGAGGCHAIYIYTDTLPADIHLAETPSDADANETESMRPHRIVACELMH